MKIGILLLTLMHSLTGEACSIGNKETYWSKNDLVDKTGTIVLASVDNVINSGRKNTWVFTPIEYLKGEKIENIELTLNSMIPGYTETTFENHTAKEFWNDSYGRLPWKPGACSPMFDFEIGGEYLLFVESLSNGASAERILKKEDRWLIYVKERIADAL